MQNVDEVKAFPPNPRPAGRAVAGTVYRSHLRLRLLCTRLLEIGVLAGRILWAKAIGDQTDGHLRPGCFPRFPCFPPPPCGKQESTPRQRTIDHTGRNVAAGQDADL